MSSHEIAQQESSVGRKGFDAALMMFVVAVMAVMALAGAGVI